MRADLYEMHSFAPLVQSALFQAGTQRRHVRSGQAPDLGQIAPGRHLVVEDQGLVHLLGGLRRRGRRLTLGRKFGLGARGEGEMDQPGLARLLLRKQQAPPGQ